MHEHNVDEPGLGLPPCTNLVALPYLSCNSLIYLVVPAGGHPCLPQF